MLWELLASVGSWDLRTLRVDPRDTGAGGFEVVLFDHKLFL